MKREQSIYVMLYHTEEQTIIMGATNTYEEARAILSDVIKRRNYTGEWETKVKYNISGGYYEIVWCPIYK